MSESEVRIDRIEKALAELAGAPWRFPPPANHSEPLAGPAARQAAVLAPLYEGAYGETRLVLTRRSALLRSHRGEIAFPGGRLDEGELPLEAALREAHEEIGLPPGHVRIIGQLDPLSTLSSNAAITPFVGAVAQLPVLVANEHEVARVFDVSLLELTSPDCHREELWLRDGGEYPVQFFEVEGETIWGATGRMLHRLLSVLAAVA